MANPSPLNPPVSTTVNVMTADISTLTPEQIQQRRNILETIELERLNAERNAKVSQEVAARKANADNMVLVHENEKARQSSCPHMKPRGLGHALAGQKTHRGWYTLICQYCGKSFSDPAQKPEERVPNHIQLDMSLIGGPHN